MWAFVSERLRRWLVLAVGAPVLAWLLGKVGDAGESRRGPDRVNGALQRLRAWLRRRARGPWPGSRRRPPADPIGPADPGVPER